MYNPKPIDTGNIVLPEEIMMLSELLAKNTHDIWASERISQGWRYGEVRDDKLKLHPCIVEYDELPEQEKEYDRKTALETLKVIMGLDFEISKKQGV